MDIERTMQFIVEQQAQFWASAQKHDQQIAELKAGMAKQDEQIAAVTGLVGRLAQAEIRLVERMEGQEARLASLETKTTQLFDRMQGQEARLASLETKTTQLFERLDRFIQGLEGNGHKPPSS